MRDYVLGSLVEGYEWGWVGAEARQRALTYLSVLLSGEVCAWFQGGDAACAICMGWGHVFCMSVHYAIQASAVVLLERRPARY